MLGIPFKTVYRHYFCHVIFCVIWSTSAMAEKINRFRVNLSGNLVLLSASVTLVLVVILVACLSQPNHSSTKTDRLDFLTTLHTGNVLSAVFSKNGEWIATAGKDGAVSLIDVEAHYNICPLRGHIGPVRSLAFAPSGSVLASGGDDTTIRLWNTGTGQEEAVLNGHSEAVYSLLFSADGQLLISGGADRSVRIWDVVSRRESKGSQAIRELLAPLLPPQMCQSWHPEAMNLAEVSWKALLGYGMPVAVEHLRPFVWNHM